MDPKIARLLPSLWQQIGLVPVYRKGSFDDL
jgi:hypothetical protein